jgi:tRNA-guanine family transglycosylase
MLDLSKEEFKQSKEPIVKGCRCYTCSNYNRAYINHMLEVKEMNANILIVIHNVTQFDLLFDQIRDNIKNIGGFIESFAEHNCVDKQ